MFFKIFGLIKFHHCPFCSVYACEMSIISWNWDFCEFPLAVGQLLLLAPLLRTPLQKILFPPEPARNNSIPYKSALKLKASIFKNPFVVIFLFQMCSKQSATNWLEMSDFSGIWSVSPGSKWKDWESTFPLEQHFAVRSHECPDWRVLF